MTLDGGRPVVRKITGEWVGAMKADQIIGDESPQRLEGRGRARGWIVFHDAPQKKEPPK
jgi:hypothetical protein